MRKIGTPKMRKFKSLPSSDPPILTRMFQDADAERTSVTGYMCAIDWQYEVGNARNGNIVYPSIDALKADHDCWQECGIVEVEVNVKKTIAPSQY